MANPVTFDDLLRLSASWLFLSIIGLLFKRQLISLTRPVLYGILFRLLFAWTILSVLGLMYSKEIMNCFIPCLIWMINLIQDDYSAILKIVDREGGQILLLATLVHDIPPLVKEDMVSALKDTMHFVIPLVALLSIFFAWPAKCLQSRIKLLLLALPLGLALMLMTVPFQLAAATEAAFQTVSQQAHLSRENPPYLIWAHFLEDGGSWLRSIAVALLGLALMQRVSSTAEADPL